MRSACIKDIRRIVLYANKRERNIQTFLFSASVSSESDKPRFLRRRRLEKATLGRKRKALAGRGRHRDPMLPKLSCNDVGNL